MTYPLVLIANKQKKASRMSVTKVIKRNGVVEDFSQSKVNDWQFWASENVRSKVNWKSVVIDTLRKLPSIVETKVLQAELVKTCMEYSSWNYGMMAGRLYATIYRKDLYKNGLPFVKNLHQKLYDLGLMEKLSYTDLEYNQIESIIDHNKDLNTSYTQLLQLRNKYSLSNGLTKERYETPQFIYMRMAMALAENEPPLEKMRMVKRWYRYFSDNKINCPTPNYTNLGTPHNGYASCCLYTVDDTARSLAIGDHIAYTMTYMSAGIGGYLNTRSLNSLVKGGKIIHQGKMPYFDSLAGAVKANMQGGRGGACTTYFSCFDVEAMTIIMAQNPRTPVDKQNRNIHFSFMYNKFFVEKVYNNEKIFSFDTASAPELAKAFIGPDYELFKKLYNKHEEENKDKLVYVSAREIAIAALRQSHEVSTLYFMQIDEANRHTPYKEQINSSNLCVAPETPLLTKEFGYKRIDSLVGQEVSVWNGEEWSKVPVVKTGENQKLLTVLTDSGSVIDATIYHKWYVQLQNEFGGATQIVEKRTHELLPGDKLIKFDLDTIEHGTKDLDMAYENGFFTGDGCYLPYERTRVYLYDNKKILLKHFNTDSEICSVRETEKRIEIDYRKNVLLPKFWIPGNEYTLSSKLKWLEGIFDSDGCLTNNNGCMTIQMVSINYDFLYHLRLFLQELGIQCAIKDAGEAGFRMMPDGKGGSASYYCKKCWRILVSNGSLIKLKNLGFTPKRIDISLLREGNRDANKFIQVKEIVDKGRFADTYCVNEPKRHMVMFGGLLTGNCLEITQPTSAYSHMSDLYSGQDHGRGEISVCSLAGVVISLVSTDDEYFEACYLALKMIDVAIHKTTYEFTHLGVTAKARMNAGVGIIGLAHYLAKRGLKYNTQEGLDEVHRVSERHMYFMLKASLKLGKELGNAPWIHKTKWPDGWLPIDTYNRNVDNVTTAPLQYDWEVLRSEIIANGGIRNSSLVAHMPSESSSKATGTPNSVYPIRSVSLKKTDLKQALKWVAMDSDELYDKYQLAWELSTEDLSKFYGVIQKFTDQSTSADYYKDRVKEPVLKASDLLDELYYMYMYGVKTRYYLSSLTIDAVKLGEIPESNAGCSSGACTL